jgi:hypothetical protein
MGGIWTEVVLRYDDSFVFKAQNRPFFIESIRPIQLSTRNIDQIVEGRQRFTLVHVPRFAPDVSLIDFNVTRELGETSRFASRA